MTVHPNDDMDTDTGQDDLAGRPVFTASDLEWLLEVVEPGYVDTLFAHDMIPAKWYEVGDDGIGRFCSVVLPFIYLLDEVAMIARSRPADGRQVARDIIDEVRDNLEWLWVAQLSGWAPRCSVTIDGQVTPLPFLRSAEAKLERTVAR
jgi:hypothetical protein